ncbi:MAG TPA: helix-turn-helix transcriptional regulator [Candidatus Acidoferrum sp.]
MKFGPILRQLRTRSGIGIKRLAPALQVNYTYLSKLENEEMSPSVELVERVAEYFDYDRNALMLSAGKVPEEILDILRQHPDEALKFLRDRFGGKHGTRHRP